ncbi:MAG: hypothetical protein C4523_10145 [Myxococcales bacterium]|nr:MAG: hypothetical protein C4523_10145 [Myxococcales bacterium]
METMLFPFDSRALVLPAFPALYLRTVLADLAQARFTGYALVADDAAARVAVLINGEAAAGLLADRLGNLVRLAADGADLFADLPEKIDFSALSAAPDAAQMARLFCRAEPVWRRPDAALDDALQAAHSQRAALCVRRRAELAEFAWIEAGEFVAGYVWDERARGFERVERAAWEMGTAATALELFFPGSLTFSLPAVDRLPDALAAILGHYGEILNDMLRRLLALPGGAGRLAAEATLKALADKYPPLYRGLHVNPETGLINWDHLIQNRPKVNLAYRYDKFTLYLDEAVMQFLQALGKAGRADGLKALATSVSRLRARLAGADLPPVAALYQKLDKALAKYS